MAEDEESHPSRVRGLKYRSQDADDRLLRVAPFTGAWIEIGNEGHFGPPGSGRTLHGCVD